MATLKLGVPVFRPRVPKTVSAVAVVTFVATRFAGPVRLTSAPLWAGSQVLAPPPPPPALGAGPMLQQPMRAVWVCASTLDASSNSAGAASSERRDGPLGRPKRSSSAIWLLLHELGDDADVGHRAGKLHGPGAAGRRLP